MVELLFSYFILNISTRPKKGLLVAIDGDDAISDGLLEVVLPKNSKVK